MTSVKISEEMGCWEMRNFSTSSHPYSHWSCDKSKNPCLLRNCIIPKFATTEAPATTHPVASWFLDPNGCLTGKYAICQWAWVLAIFHHNDGNSYPLNMPNSCVVRTVQRATAIAVQHAGRTFARPRQDLLYCFLVFVLFVFVCLQ